MADILGARVSDDTQKLFHELVEKSPIKTKGEFMEHIIKKYAELEVTAQTKENVSILKPALETVETLTSRILDVLNGAGAIITTNEEEFKQKLTSERESFEETRALLQQRISSLEQDRAAGEERIQSFIEDKEAAEGKMGELLQQNKQLESTINDKSALIEEYKRKNDDLSSIVSEYKTAAEKSKKLEQDNIGFKQNIVALESQIHLSKDKLNEQAARHAEDLNRLKDALTLEHDKKLLESEKTHQRELQGQQELYNEKVKSLLERLEANPAIAPTASPTPSRAKKSSSKKSTNTSATEQHTENA